MREKTRDEHLFGPGPKRILALDGGGIRGVITLAYLERIESLLSKRAGAQVRLCDYFDLIAGTSTGSIIAAALATGWHAEEVAELYSLFGKQVLRVRRWKLPFVSAKFRHAPLSLLLRHHFDDLKLGDSEIQTGLLIVAKRVDTGSPWVIHNNPRGMYFDDPEAPNREFSLREVVLASTAAPVYFEPMKLRVGRKIEGAFVDGGVSPFVNPALAALMVACLEGYGLNWPMGADKIHLVSIGTGTRQVRMAADEVMKMTAAGVGYRALKSMMNDAKWLTQALLQWMSNSPTPWEYDSEVGDLAGDLLGGRELLSYVRYDVILNADWLTTQLDLPIEPEEARQLARMDDPANVDPLSEIGRRGASKQVRERHFPTVFDPD